MTGCRIDLDPLDDDALGALGWRDRAIPVLVLAVVIGLCVLVLSVVNPGRTVDRVDGPPPIDAIEGITVRVATPAEQQAGTRPPLAQTDPDEGRVLVDDFDGQLERWKVPDQFSTAGGRLTAAGPGEMVLTEAVDVVGAELDLVPMTPDAGLALTTPTERWAWTAGPKGLLLVRTVGGESAVVHSGVALPAAVAGTTPRLGLRMSGDDLVATVGGVPIVTVTTPLPLAGARLSVVVTGRTEGVALTAVADRVAVLVAP